jgi:DNA ligase-associated metallophosphoesterase
MSLTATLRSQENNDMPGSAVEIVVAGTPVVCDRMGVAFLEKSRLLVVSDLHLEKGAAFARRGMFLPPYDTAATLDLLEAAIRRYRPGGVVSLGDSFHDRKGADHLSPVHAARLKGLMRGLDWYWIAGNHDPDAPANLPGESVAGIAVEGLSFRHEPLGRQSDAKGEVAGHLHPAARIVRRGRSVRRPCFASDGERLVMPAFGVTTGGLDLRHRAMAGLFDRSRLLAHMLGRERIYTVRFANLVG